MISPPPHQIVLTVEMAVMMTNPCALMVLPVTGTYMYIMIKTKTAKNKTICMICNMCIVHLNVCWSLRSTSSIFCVDYQYTKSMILTFDWIGMHFACYYLGKTLHIERSTDILHHPLPVSQLVLCPVVHPLYVLVYAWSTLNFCYSHNRECY